MPDEVTHLSAGPPIKCLTGTKGTPAHSLGAAVIKSLLEQTDLGPAQFSRLPRLILGQAYRR